jgi:hypothetical protein
MPTSHAAAASLKPSFGRCDCKSRCDNNCSNYAFDLICTPSNCYLGASSCGNSLSDLLATQSIEQYQTGNMGCGIRAIRAIQVYRIVGLYLGYVKMWGQSARSTPYTVKVGVLVWEAQDYDSPMRYVNHSCDPNCALIQHHDDHELNLPIWTLRDIEPGEQITIDYNWGEMQDPIKCECGSGKKCRGFIGKKLKPIKKEISPQRLTGSREDVMAGATVTDSVGTTQDDGPDHTN